MKLSKKLIELRKKQKLSVTECALLIGVSPSTYRDWEYGRSIRGEEPYQKLAKLFGVSLAELFGESPSDAIKELDLVEDKLKELINSVKSIRSRL